MKKLIIIGAGGNSKVIIDIIKARNKILKENIEIMGVLDDDENKKELLGYPVLGKINDIDKYIKESNILFVNGIGDNNIRKKTTEIINQKIETPKFYTAIYPSVIIGSNVIIGMGTVIMPNVVINADSMIGQHTIINTGVIVEHDNIIEDYVHLASTTTTAGNVKIGEATLVGTGAKIIQGISIGKNAIVGAGAVVIKNIPDNTTAVGVPAKVIKS